MRNLLEVAQNFWVSMTSCDPSFSSRGILGTVPFRVNAKNELDTAKHVSPKLRLTPIV